MYLYNYNINMCKFGEGVPAAPGPIRPGRRLKGQGAKR